MYHQKETSRQKQAAKTKHKIAKTAIELFRKNGYNNITILDICRKAGVSVGTFYHYFESKGAVFSIVIDEIDRNLFTYCDGEESQAQSCLQAIDDFVRYFIKSHSEIQRDILTLWLSPEFRAIGDSAGSRSFEALLRIISEGQNRGEIMTEMTAEEITKYIFIEAKGLLSDWCLHQGEYDLFAYEKGLRVLLQRSLQK